MGRERRRRDDRDGSGFVAIPHVVMDSASFIALSGPAIKLLLDISRQLKTDNNGSLVASMAYMRGRGWTSNDTLTRARRELESSGLIVETRKGMRPNVAALFAVTWRGYDYVAGRHDLPLKQFPRGAYLKNAALTPSHGVGGSEIAPSHGVEAASSTPSHGAMKAGFAPSPTPSDGDLSRFTISSTQSPDQEARP